MSLLPADVFRRFLCSLRSAELRDGTTLPPPERLLQNIWYHQRLLRDRLITIDGRTLRVLHPGFWNREAGPDFREAVLQFNDEAPVSGDVEVDVHTAGWKQHGHDRNVNFRKVILHVVWDLPGTPRSLSPTLALRAYLDAPAEELEAWFRGLPDDWPADLRGKCSAPLRHLGREQIQELLLQAASVRLERKAAELRLRARQAGWEQALWEGLFRALGFKNNTWPMLRLAELLELLHQSAPVSVTAWQAHLLGVSGLLPSDTTGRSLITRKYVRELWDHWWRSRNHFATSVLPASIWKFHGLRPANRPERRLAVAASWLQSRDLIRRLEKWFHLDDKTFPQSLRLLLEEAPDPFWSRHWSFGTPRLRRPVPLLGDQRVTDLAMNVILPWFWSRSETGGNREMKGLAEKRYFAWPSGQDNAILRLARERLLRGIRLPPGAASQQGLLQIVRDFCDHSNSICESCRFPELVREIREWGEKEHP